MAIKSSSLIVFILACFLSTLFVTGNAQQFHRLPVNHNVVGPESIAFDCQGRGPYVGVADGRIFRWDGQRVGWVEFAVTSPYRSRRCDRQQGFPSERYCGRPLGLKFDKSTCELYIADSVFGLVKVGRNGGAATPVSSGIDGIPYRFLNALDIDSDSGIVYFTDTSTNYHRWEYGLAMNNNDHTGRLMKYDTKTKEVTVLLHGLAFANGVALSQNKEFVLVAETTAYQIRRFWLMGPRTGTSDIFKRLSGRPDNINRNSKGEFWVAQNPSKPVKLDQHGNVLESLNAPEIRDSSDVTEFRNAIWIGSVDQPYVLSKAL